jgi:pentose-5-phosphate-3-epimerase
MDTVMSPKTPRLSAGVLTADLTRLGDELEILRGKAAWAHVDVMDGVFCPQLTVGPAFVAAVASTGIEVDAHLITEEPRRLLPEIAAAGAAVITVHAEATRHLHRTMAEMTALAGPDHKFLRGVDGGVTLGNAAEIAGWGADVIVSGSAIYDRKDPAGNLDLMIKQLSHSEEAPDGKR